jgi:large subunit ribosomal protein L25
MNMIKVRMRDPKTKAKQLRRSGAVPCCVYGGSLQDSLPIQMDQQNATQLLREKRNGSKVQLNLDGQLIPVQIKEKTRNFSNGKVEHISFQALQADQQVNSVAHIILKNTDTVPGVLEKLLFEVPFTSLPKDMIDTVTVDLEGLPTGTVLTLRDIPEFMCEQVQLRVPADTIVLRVNDKRRAASQWADPSQPV